MNASPGPAGIPPLPELPAPQAPQGDSTGGLIPYKNPSALAAYYLGIVSGLPIIGLPFGIAAFIFGLKGLKAKRQNPAVKGTVHAAIGIGCGGVFAVLWALVIFSLAIAFLSAR